MFTLVAVADCFAGSENKHMTSQKIPYKVGDRVKIKHQQESYRIEGMNMLAEDAKTSEHIIGDFHIVEVRTGEYVLLKAILGTEATSPEWEHITSRERTLVVHVEDLLLVP